MAYKEAQRHSKTTDEAKKHFSTIQRNRKEKAVANFKKVLKLTIEQNEPISCLKK